MSNRLLLTLVCGCALTPGCAAWNSTQQMFAQSVHALRPTTGNYSDPTAQSGDPWVQSAGVEARGDRPKEIVNDPLHLRNIFMSEKARDIERNMGIE